MSNYLEPDKYDLICSILEYLTDYHFIWNNESQIRFYNNTKWIFEISPKVAYSYSAWEILALHLSSIDAWLKWVNKYNDN